MDTSGMFPAQSRPRYWWPQASHDSAEQRPHAWAAFLAGAGLGLVWGGAARLWMRSIATHPEFSIEGTAGILIIAALFGAFTGLAYAARRRGWRGWRYYSARSLAVIFFIPFGAAGGMPLMLTVLLTAVGMTQRGVIGLWVVAGLALLLAMATDIGVPMQAALLAFVLAVALTVWTWLARRWRGKPWIVRADRWLDRSGRLVPLLLAAAGLVWVVCSILEARPGLVGAVAIIIYLALLYPLLLALCVGLTPRAGENRRVALPSQA